VLTRSLRDVIKYGNKSGKKVSNSTLYPNKAFISNLVKNCRMHLKIVVFLKFVIRVKDAQNLLFELMVNIK